MLVTDSLKCTQRHNEFITMILLKKREELDEKKDTEEESKGKRKNKRGRELSNDLILTGIYIFLHNKPACCAANFQHSSIMMALAIKTLFS